MKALFFLVFLTASISAEIQENSLLHKCWNCYSQNGEEGILDEMVNRLKIRDGFFIEFGAADGILYSNTRFLAERGWRGVFIEANSTLIPNLFKNCEALPNLLCLHEFVASNNSDKRGITLDALADCYFPDQEIDVLSIDIDGEDYLILEGLKRKPKIICIESSGYWHPQLKDRVPDSVARHNLGQPLPVIVKSAQAQGYTPVCFLVVNLFLVRNDYAHLFSEIKNDPLSLWSDSWSYMVKNYPSHVQYILRTREVEPLIRTYDTFPIKPPVIE